MIAIVACPGGRGWDATCRTAEGARGSSHASGGATSVGEEGLAVRQAFLKRCQV